MEGGKGRLGLERCWVRAMWSWWVIMWEEIQGRRRGGGGGGLVVRRWCLVGRFVDMVGGVEWW